MSTFSNNIYIAESEINIADYLLSSSVDYRYYNIIADHVSYAIELLLKTIMRYYGFGFANARSYISGIVDIANINNIDLMLPTEIEECLYLLDTWNLEARSNVDLEIDISICSTMIDLTQEYIEFIRKALSLD